MLSHLTGAVGTSKVCPLRLVVVPSDLQHTLGATTHGKSHIEAYGLSHVLCSQKVPHIS